MVDGSEFELFKAEFLCLTATDAVPHRLAVLSCASFAIPFSQRTVVYVHVDGGRNSDVVGGQRSS